MSKFFAEDNRNQARLLRFGSIVAVAVVLIAVIYALFSRTLISFTLMKFAIVSAPLLLFLAVVLMLFTLTIRAMITSSKGRYLWTIRVQARTEECDFAAATSISEQPFISISKCLKDNSRLLRPNREAITAGVALAVAAFALRFFPHGFPEQIGAATFRYLYELFYGAAILFLFYVYVLGRNRELRQDTNVLELAKTIARERMRRANALSTKDTPVKARKSDLGEDSENESDDEESDDSEDDRKTSSKQLAI